VICSLLTVHDVKVTFYVMTISAVGNNPKSMAVVRDAVRTVRSKSREIMEDT